MKQTLIDLFTSKKFLAALTAIIVYVGGRFGLHVDPTALDHIWQALLVYVGAQGLADIGKSAAEVNAAADSAPIVTESSPGSRVGSVATVSLLMLAIAGAALVPACGPKSTAILDAAIDCTTQARADLVSAILPTAESAIDRIKDPTTGKVTTDALRALFSGASLSSEAGVILACAEAKAVSVLATLLPQPKTLVTSAMSPGVKLDTDSLRAAFAAQFPGSSFTTSAAP